LDIPTTISIIVGTLSVAIACFAMVQAQTAARESRANHEKTKDVLGQIDKKAEVIEKVVADNQRDLLETVKKLAIPEKPNLGEEIGMEFFKAMIQDPDKFNSMIPTLVQLSQQADNNAEGRREV
jgi:hypothetical protein